MQLGAWCAEQIFYYRPPQHDIGKNFKNYGKETLVGRSFI
jgi:hypothetical protein